MIPFLAESFGSNFNWTLIFTGIMSIATAAMWWDARSRGGDKVKIESPVQIQKSYPSATTMDLKESHGSLEKRVDGLEVDVEAIKSSIVGNEWFDRMERDIENIRNTDAQYRENKDKADSTHRASLYKAIEASRLELHSEIASLQEKVRTIPNELVALLKNTGVIK